MITKGWTELDVLLVSGDAYVDHPSFGIALIARVLEKQGLRVGILPQPRFNDEKDFLLMGRPRLFIGISSGSVDSMLNNYTASKKTRSDDDYSEAGRGGLRPDDACQVFCELARRAFPDTPILLGGVEASLRRLAYYDYWKNTVRPALLLDAPADLLVYGMGERATGTIAVELKKVSDQLQAPLSRDSADVQAALQKLKHERGVAYVTSKDEARILSPRLTLPSFEEIKRDKKRFLKTALLMERETNPVNAQIIVQNHGSRAVVINPPALPLSTEELDALYELPYMRLPHPRYQGKIQAYEMIRFSITTNRGCFGGCSFCSLSMHQGRVIQSRSVDSILREIDLVASLPGFTGIISDLGGPTANMYMLNCANKKAHLECRKPSCLYPKPCTHLKTDHEEQIRMLQAVRKHPKVRKAHIASGLRFDLALADQKSGLSYLKELVSHHVGGQLKVAPEHLDLQVLHLMRKTGALRFDEFQKLFSRLCEEAGKEQYLVPYFMSGFPGCSHEQMEKVHLYLKQKNWKLQQVQAFIPTPMTLATAMYWSGLDPLSGKELFVSKQARDRKIQRALLQPGKGRFRRRSEP